MAKPIDFVPIHLSCADEKSGRKQMREMLGAGWWRLRGPVAWAGFAAEHSIRRSINAVPGETWCRPSPVFEFDLALGKGVESLIEFQTKYIGNTTKVEVKTRTVTDGWTDPNRYDYVTVPMHQDREPIKDVDLVIFNWYSASDPRRLWVLGYVRGLEEFKRRAVFYKGGDPLPRGGWAKGSGAYVIEVSQMRPLPRGMLKGDDK